METNFTPYLEVRFGRGVKMYTLWNIGLSREYFIQNLSANLEKAIEKAKELFPTKEIIVSAPDTLNPIVKGDDVIRFGKYKDKRITEINDDKYLFWIWRGASVKDKDGYWINLVTHESPLKVKAAEILLSKGLLIEHNDTLMTIERYNQIQSDLNSTYVGSIGERRLFDLTIRKITGYETMYGYTSVYIMNDNDNNIIIYKGGGLGKYDEEGYYKSLTLGDKVKMQATIKEHSDYNGVKQTIIQRPKIK